MASGAESAASTCSGAVAVTAWLLDIFALLLTAVRFFYGCTGGVFRTSKPAVLLLPYLPIVLVVLLGLRLGLVAIPGSRFVNSPVRRLLSAASALIEAHDGWRTRVALGVIVALSLYSKLQVAVAIPGFMAGDDSEIHAFSFSVLFHRPYQAWSLRSPLYPLGFIYPAQALVHAIIPGSTDALIIAGRLVVIAFSLLCLVLTFRAGKAISGSAAIGVTAAFFLAANQTHNMFSGSELPRPVSATFVVLAFLAMRGDSGVPGVVKAGVWLALAECLRFSEGIFMIPAVAELVLKKRWKETAVLCLSFGLGMLAIQSAVDLLYWGKPLQSLINIVKFTIIERASTRGLQPFDEYLRTIPIWSSPALVILAAGAIRLRRPALGLWTWLPILTLSCLPHKEPRYLVPSLPFLALSAALALASLVKWIRARPRWAAQWEVIGFSVLVVVALAVGDQLGKRLRIGRCNGWVPVARYLEQRGAVGGVAIEDFLAWDGPDLYLRNASRVERIDWLKLFDEATREKFLAPDVRWVAVRPEPLAVTDIRTWLRVNYPALDQSIIDRAPEKILSLGAWLGKHGFREVTLPANLGVNSATYRLFERATQENR